MAFLVRGISQIHTHRDTHTHTSGLERHGETKKDKTGHRVEVVVSKSIKVTLHYIQRGKTGSPAELHELEHEGNTIQIL